MSIKYLNDAWSMPLNAHEKIVLLAISDWANDEGVAYPSYKALMKKTGMAKATLAKHLKLLRDLGSLKTENHSEFGQGKKVNLYTISSRVELPYSSDIELIARIKELRKKHASPKSSHLELPKVQNVDPKSSTLEHEPSVITTINEPSVKARAKKFTPPTEVEIASYAKQEGLNLSGFFDYYESNGWMVARNKMKNWQAAARNWSKRQATYGGNNATYKQSNQLTGAAARTAETLERIKNM